jgi:hypothetical protein
MKIFFNERKAKVVLIQSHVRGWIKRRKVMRELKQLLELSGNADLLLTNRQILERNALCMIAYWMTKWFRRLKRSQLENAAALRIQKIYKGRFERNSSFINALNLSQSPRIYFLKE